MASPNSWKEAEEQRSKDTEVEVCVLFEGQASHCGRSPRWEVVKD